MATRENEPLAGRARVEGDDGGEPRAEPGDEYFSSGSFSPVTVQLEEEPERPGRDGEAEAPRAAPDIDDSPQVFVQFGEDPGAVAQDDPDEEQA